MNRRGFFAPLLALLRCPMIGHRRYAAITSSQIKAGRITAEQFSSVSLFHPEVKDAARA